MMIQRPARFTRFRATLLATPMLLSIALAALAEEPTVLRGRVLLPDGKPAVGAELYWVRFEPASPGMPYAFAFDERPAADDQGRFEFPLEQDAPLRNISLSLEKKPPRLMAYLPGYGVDWLEIVRDRVPHEAVLRLVADHPIRGRVIDTEGRRVADAKIAVTIVAAATSGSLDEFLTGKEVSPNAGMGLERQCNAPRLLPRLKTVTDREGCFELSGVGVDRLAWVNISAAGLASGDLEIVNRDGFDAERCKEAVLAGTLPRRFSTLTGPLIEHVAETELVIRGTIFTGADRKPVARVPVGGGSIFAQTDEMGRFELRGLRRGTNVRLAVYSPLAGNLLTRSIRLDVAVGQTVVETEVEVKEGVVIEGRVFDKVTMRGVESEIRFAALPENHYVIQPGYDGFVPHIRTDEEGRFRMLVPPGRVVLMAQVSVGGVLAQAKMVTPYRQASFSEEDAKSVPVAVTNGVQYFVGMMSGRQVQQGLSILNAVKFLELSPRSGPVTCDLALETGKTVKLAIEDEQGRPVTGALVSRMSDSLYRTRRIAEASCDILGLGADRPRRIVILQPERHLAGSLTLTGDEPAQVSVRLSTTASIKGRALDADGEPLAGARVQIRYDRDGVLHDERAEPKTDGDGKFHVENVLPGERVELAFIQGGKFFSGPKIADEKRQLEPGEQLELGEFSLKKP
jgi:hypothetical protein